MLHVSASILWGLIHFPFPVHFVLPSPISLSLSFCNLLGVLCLSLAELDAEHAQKVLETEHAQQVKLKERQKYFEEAFQQDMEQYLSTGYLQITDRRGQFLIFEGPLLHILVQMSEIDL